MSASPAATNPTAARTATLRLIDAHREMRLAAQELATHGDAAQHEAAIEVLAACERLWRPVASIGATV